MPDFSAFPIGITLLFVGLAFLMLAYLLARLFPRLFSASARAINQADLDLDVPKHEDATLVIQPGGRVVFMNDAARNEFDVWEQTPNLERLARRTRPENVFLSLCAVEGNAHLSVGGRLMEATSYKIPYQQENAILLSLHPYHVATLTEGEGDEASGQAIEILTKLGQSMASELELEATMQAILSGVGQIVSVDCAEIAIWDPEKGHLIPYRFDEKEDGQIEDTLDRYALGEGYSGHVAASREPLLVSDVEASSKLSPLINRQQYPFRSYLGIPLLIGGELIGVLAITSLVENAYDQNDVKLLDLLSGQAAIALHNALLYRQEKLRASELSGLANLSQAVSAVQEPEELFAHLVEEIAPLLDVEVAGFLIYDQTSRVLAAQQPFMGVPEQFVALYHISIPPDSPAERIWRQQETLVVDDAPEDHRLIDLGLDHPARAAGIRETVLAPLKVGGRSLGYLQVANKKKGDSFSQADVRLLAIIAGQAAPIIKNANLIQHSIKRALRAEALRRVASLTGSEAALDEILKYSLMELSRLLEADIAVLFFLQESVGGLQAHADSIYGLPDRVDAEIGQLLVEPEDFANLVSNSKQPLFITDMRVGQSLSPPYDLLAERLDFQSLIVVPLAFRDRRLGEIVLGSRQAERFSRSDLQLASSVAGQLAVAMERTSLAAQSDADLRQRVETLTKLTRIGRELNALLDVEQILKRVYQEAVEMIAADGGAVYRFDVTGEDSATPEILFPEGQGEGWSPFASAALHSQTSLLVENTERLPGTLAESTLEPPHDRICSVVTVPIMIQQKMIGLLDLHSRTPDAFHDFSLQVVQSLAAYAAVAIQNVRRYRDQLHDRQELSRRKNALARVLASTRKARLDRPLKVFLGEAASAIRQVASFPGVLIALRRDDDQLDWLTGAVSSERLKRMRSFQLVWPEVQALLRSEHLLASSYFIPVDQPANFPEWLVTLAAPEQNRASSTGAALLMPLFQVANRPLGLIAIGPFEADAYPDRSSLEILAEFARQISWLISNYDRFGQLESQVQTLESGLKEARESAVNILGNRLLAQSENRVNAVLEMVEQLARQPDRSAVLKTLGQGLIEQLGMDVTLVVETDAGGPALLHVLGDLPADVNLAPLLGQRNPLHDSLRSGALHLVADMESRQVWDQSPLLDALNSRSFISLPILAQAGKPAAILTVSSATLPPFTPENERLFDLLGRQTGMVLNNLTLLTETGQQLSRVNILLDFSRQLSGLEPERILRLLTETALAVVQPAQACVATLFDRERQVLQPHVAMGYSHDDIILQLCFLLGDALVGKAFESGKAIRVHDVDFSTHYNLSQGDLLRYRQATGEVLPVSSMAIPIQAGDEVKGVLILDNFEQSNAFSHENQILAASLARQAALTLENIHLYRTAKQHSVQLEGLSEISATITAHLELDALVDMLLETLGDFVSYDAGTLWLHEDGELTIRSVRGSVDRSDLVGATTCVEDNPLFAEMAQTGEPIAIGDIREEERLPEATPECLSWLSVPMSIKDEVMGIITLEKREAHFYSGDHLRMLGIFANQAAVAIQNARLFAQAQRFRKELEQRVAERTEQLEEQRWRAESLLKIMQELSASLDLDHILNRTLKAVNEITDAEQSTLLLIRSDERTFYHRASLGYTQSPPPGGHSTDLAIDEGLAGWVVSERKPVLIDDLRQEVHWVDIDDFKTEHRSALVLPLIFGEEVLGVLLVFHREEGHFSPKQMELAQAASNQIAGSINKSELFNLIREQAERLGKMLHAQQVETSRSRSILEAVADGVLVTDANRRITLFNDSAEQILGLKRGKIIGKSLQDFSGLFGKAAQTWMDTIKKWSSSPSDYSDDQVYAEEITLEDRRVVSVHLAPVRMQDEFLGTVSIFRDITHQVELDRLKSEFVANVSHELRTPMTSIKGYVDVLLMGAAGQLSERQINFLEVVQGNTERLNVLVNDLLDVSRIETGKFDLSMQSLRLQPLIEDVVDEQHRRMQANGREIDLDLKLPPDLPSVWGDDRRVRQIVTNLVSNAYHYTPNGGNILVKASVEGDYVRVDVKDDGIGIPPEEQDRIFERFYRGENPMVLATAGTGLGLSIVRQLVEVHEGEITFESSGVPGEGSAFSFTLPIHHTG